MQSRPYTEPIAIKSDGARAQLKQRNADDIDRDQGKRLQVALFPAVNFLLRLLKRMQARNA